MSARRLEILCLLRAGLSPFHGARGRQMGVVVRSVTWLRLNGYLRRRGETLCLSKKARAITG